MGCRILTKKQLRGVSLLEVLAAIFVISIGLLGVLAVIPFGAFQVSKANHAEYASNMLANAAEEILIRKMANPMSWGLVVDEQLSSAGIPVFKKENQPEKSPLNCTKFLWIEPQVMSDPPEHIFCIGATFKPPDKSGNPTNNWTEWMTGQDDILFTYHSNKRPDLAGQPGDRIQGSGKYTWFFTYLPQPSDDNGSLDAVPLGNLVSPVTVDILACHNRVPTDDVQVPDVEFISSSGGGRFTFPDTEHLELLTQTKYVFVTWEDASILKGAWCKIVFLDKDERSRKPKIVVTGSLPDVPGNGMYVYIPSGVLYHKRLEGVRIIL